MYESEEKMNHSEREKAARELMFSLSLYYEDDDLYQKLENIFFSLKIQQSIPRVLFEAGFLTGWCWMVQSALEINPKLLPEKETTVRTLLQRINDKEYEIRVKDTEITKSEDEVAWQEWRMEGIERGLYEWDVFPTYFFSSIHPTSPTSAVVRSNITAKEKESSINYICKNDYQTIPYCLEDRVTSSVDSLFRFSYRARFSSPLPEEIIKALQASQRYNQPRK